MTNGPQKENGFTPIANEIMEVLASSKFTTREYKCLLFLLRKTYGYSKLEDAISLSQWVKGTGLYKIDISRTLQRLADRSVIVATTSGSGRGAKTVYRFNKHYEQWDRDGKATPKGSEAATSFEWKKGSEAATYPEPEKGSEKADKRVAASLPTKERKKVVAAATENRGSFIAAYEHIWGMVIESSMKAEMIHDWQDRITLAMWEYGLTESMKANARNWKYLESILRRVEVEGLPMNGAVKEHAPQTITIIDPVTKQPKEVTV
jgi:phage replication O-like protein O